MMVTSFHFKINKNCRFSKTDLNVPSPKWIMWRNFHRQMRHYFEYAIVKWDIILNMPSSTSMFTIETLFHKRQHFRNYLGVGHSTFLPSAHVQGTSIVRLFGFEKTVVLWKTIKSSSAWHHPNNIHIDGALLTLATVLSKTKLHHELYLFLTTFLE